MGSRPHGLGRRLNYGEDGILCLEIDNVRSAGKLNSTGREHVGRARSYTEATPSGTGLRIVFKAKIPPAFHERLSSAASIKIIPKGRLVDFPAVELQLFLRNSYVTITGDRINECTVVETRQEYLDFLVSLWLSHNPSRFTDRGCATVGRLSVNVRKFRVGGSEMKSNLMKIEMWPVEKPVPYPKNARKISDQAVEKVASSIQAFGFRANLSWWTRKA
jgi:hypothetical protein